MKYVLIFLFSIFVAWQFEPVSAEPVHGIAMQGKPALAADFTHLPYANPDAPQGGIYRRAIIGSYDSLNPLIVKGRAAAFLRVYIFESLLGRNRSEPFSLYGLIAEKIDVPDDRSKITFYLNKKAHFSDGSAILSSDVLFSFKTLRDKGRPNHRGYYKKVLRAEVVDNHTITFHLDGKDQELVLILGLMPILSEKYFSEHDFTKTTLTPIIGSGPYVIDRFKAGQSIVYKRDPNYWGNDLAINKGLWNFQEVRFEYFRDNQAAFEAFKKNLVDSRFESDPGKWTTSYDFAAVKAKKVVLDTVQTKLPKPTSALVFNTRRKIFSDVRVREALGYVFDFEWANANLFYGLFRRTQGFYTESNLSSIKRPANAIEKQLLSAAGADIPERFMDGTFAQPVSDGSGRDRKALRKAVMLLAKAGWTFKNRVLSNGKTGKPFAFEIVVQNPEQEKIALHFQRSLRQIGIAMTIRQVDSSQFQRRLQTYDFDMLPYTWYNSLSPGNEQAFYWGSNGVKQEGTRNYMGVANPAIDKMIDEMVKAPSGEAFIASVRALDRLLVSGFYIIPLYHTGGQWLARWSHVKYSKNTSNYGFRAEAAWFEKQ